MNYLTQLIKVTPILLLFLTDTVCAQQDPQYTNYMYNTMNVNPAYAGTKEVLSILGMYRAQWVGLDGAPVTSTFSLHSPIGFSNIGLGLSFVNDKIGPSDENTISVDFSYRLNFDNLSTLALGIKTTANLLNVDYTKLSIYDPTDPQFQNNVDNRFSPNFGAGAYWYSDKHYVGFSIPNFLETKHYDDNDRNSLAKEKMHYYFMAGYVFDLTSEIKMKPAFLSKMVAGAPLQIDMTANFLFFEKLTVGAAYRLNASVSGLVAFQLSDKLLVGYSYDAETTKLAHYNSGSHEIFLRFEVFREAEKIYSPRFF
ncbi:type IX secretion system membrane protein PorP/SprF [Flavobacterium sp. HXWNR29]|uniref:PorP/SprF family type IX secretion system membrane protein n=1 Tax=Flavobacterium odoriferum TaxID=2946604 RepID=UPI0021CB0825|nr:type IX secretion system membrane protein PorP/SprF [Flavobacterium sp. HXWNR29]MCU4189510.1 type IX secretion system membrane protein PorP/SprF [Flavobacterium sp. HXWNR29]